MFSVFFENGRETIARSEDVPILTEVGLIVPLMIDQRELFL